MKLLSKVVWEEGMYLAPQHFQAQNRYFEEAVHFATAALWRDAYGFADYQLDADAIRNGTVSLLQGRGMFDDGLAFDMPDPDPLPAPCNIADQFSPTATELVVSLAVPGLVSDGQNCSLENSSGGNIRYNRVAKVLHDENTGRDEKPVGLGYKNIRLDVEAGESETTLRLPLARVVRDGSGHFAFDPSFVAPCMRINASQHLTDMLHRLVGILEEKSSVVSEEQQHSAAKFQAGTSARHVSQFWFLHAINSGLTALRHLLLSKHGHPEELFREMSRLAGALCTFGLDTHPRTLPAYDHRDPGPGFQLLDDHIRKLLEVVVPSLTISIPLNATERYFYQGEVKDQRCFGHSRWVLGIRAQVGEADLISRTGQFVKVCSSKFVPELVKRALPGLTLSHMQVPPSAIAAKVDSQYFTISRSGPCWEHILQTRNVGVYVPGELPSPELELIVLLEV